MGVGAAEDFPELPPVNTKASTSEATAADGYRYEEQPLSPASKAFLHRNFFTVIACALEFQNKMDIDVLREHLAKTFIRHPRFRSKVVGRGRRAEDALGDATHAFHCLQSTQTPQAAVHLSEAHPSLFQVKLSQAQLNG